MKDGIGARLTRREDDALLRGRGRFVGDDEKNPGMRNTRECLHLVPQIESLREIDYFE